MSSIFLCRLRPSLSSVNLTRKLRTTSLATHSGRAHSASQMSEQLLAQAPFFPCLAIRTLLVVLACKIPHLSTCYSRPTLKFKCMEMGRMRVTFRAQAGQDSTGLSCEAIQRAKTGFTRNIAREVLHSISRVASITTSVKFQLETHSTINPIYFREVVMEAMLNTWSAPALVLR